MRSWQQWYKNLLKIKHQPSIAKEEHSLLADRLSKPHFSYMLTFKEGVLCVIGWSVFATGFKINTFSSFKDILTIFVIEVLIISCTLVPSIFLIKLQHDSLKTIRIYKVVLRVLMTTVPIGIIASLLVLFSANSVGFITFNADTIFLKTAIYVLDLFILTAAILVYSIRRYQELGLLKKMFNTEMDQQNDHIKTRLAPHFFFNTLNTLAYLVETNNDKASELIQHVSHLFRSSFNEPKESSFEEEIELCEHYLSIEHYRLQDKLVVVWELPDEDLVYDMTITSLTLQNVLEQTVLHVVEMTTNTVYVHVKANWQNHMVTIVVSVELPKNMIMPYNNIVKTLDFSVQQSRLREHFGATATITTKNIDNKIFNTITYPLHDAFN